MDNEENLWIKAIAICFIAAILTVGGCNSYKTAKITEAAIHGVDLVKLNCALESTASATCIIMATKQ
jgi:hypothetical protein